MLHIIYRTCGGEDTRAEHKRWRKHSGEGPAPFERTEWFDKRTCFRSFARDLDANVRVTVVYDGDRPLLRNYIVNNWIERQPDRIALHPIDVHDNRQSLLACYALADEDTAADSFYFLEDDYLHRPGWLTALREGLSTLPDGSLVTLYDHPDRYTRQDDVGAGQEAIRLSRSTHWRTAESTTCTVAMRQMTWRRHREIFIKGGIRDRETYRTLAAAGVRLWQPVPGFSTHDHVKRLSPLIDWRAVSAAV